jgi:hypothetical protein
MLSFPSSNNSSKKTNNLEKTTKKTLRELQQQEKKNKLAKKAIHELQEKKPTKKPVPSELCCPVFKASFPRKEQVLEHISTSKKGKGHTKYTRKHQLIHRRKNEAELK